MDRTIQCNKKCCTIHVTPYNKTHTYDYGRTDKSGILLVNEDDNCVLIIQSRGNLWGIPKGTLKEGESYDEAAIRETYEETGIKIPNEKLSENTLQISSSLYYVCYVDKLHVSVQKNSDANSVGWVNLNCLRHMIDDEVIRLTKHTKIILKYFLKFE